MIVELNNAKQLCGANSEQSANELLKKGWVLIAVAPGKNEEGYPFTKYSLAWFKDSNPIY